jgi:hypothetical protein
MSNIGLKISKEGEDVKTCADKDLILSSEFDTLKIGFSGRLTLNYPDWEYNYIDEPVRKVDTMSFSHNLGYIPYYTPRCVAEQLSSGAEMGSETDYINEIVQSGPFTNYSPPLWERALIDVYATTTKLYIRTSREINYATGPRSGTWEGGTVYMDYAIFRNSLSEEFNLLEN